MVLLCCFADTAKAGSPRLNQAHLCKNLCYDTVSLFGTSADCFFQCQAVAQSAWRSNFQTVIIQRYLHTGCIKKVPMTVCIYYHLTNSCRRKLMLFPAHKPFHFCTPADIAKHKSICFLNLLIQRPGILLPVNKFSPVSSSKNSTLRF